jgi:hypothetical protein
MVLDADGRHPAIVDCFRMAHDTLRANSRQIVAAL